MKWFLLLVLAAALAAVLYALFVRGRNARTPADSANAKVENLAALGVLDAERGDLVSVLARGHEFSDLDFTIDRINGYSTPDGREQWRELSGSYRGARVFLEAWEDDGVHVVLTGADSGVPFNEIGLGEADLIRLDETKDTTQTVEWGGSVWRFESAGEYMFGEDGWDRTAPPEGHYVWEFREEGGPRVLCVEKWEGEAFEASVSEEVPPGDVRVFRA